MDVYIHIHMHMYINDLHETNVQTIFFLLLFCYQSVIFDLIAVGGWGLSFACQDAIGWQRPLQLLY